MRLPLRAILALTLLVGFFLLLLALTVGLVVAAVYAFSTGRASSIKLALAAVFVAVAVGSAIRAVLRVRQEPHGAVIDRADQPALWAMVDELAAIARTRGPDEIRLVPEVNAAVWEEAPLLGLRAGRRYLEIGLPLLAGLNVSELRAVLAHELGHYSHGHTKLSALTYRATMAVGHTVDRLDGVFKWLFKGYAWLYLLVARSANRAQELDADALSVAAAGRAATRSALRRVAALDAAWSFYCEAYLGLAPRAGRTPDILAGFRAFLEHPERRHTLAGLEEKLLDAEPASVFDSHPTARRRIAAVEKLPDPGLPVDGRPAWTLLRDPARTVPALEGQLLVDGLGPRAGWPEIVRLAGAREAEFHAALLARAGAESGTAPSGTLGELLAAVEHGAGQRLVAPLLKPDLPPEQLPTATREVLAELLGQTVVAVLTHTGRAYHELNWGGPWRLRLADGTELDVERLVTPVVDHPGNVPMLRNWLAHHGVPLNYVPPAPVEQPTATPA